MATNSTTELSEMANVVVKGESQGGRRHEYGPMCRLATSVKGKRGKIVAVKMSQT